MTLGEKIKKIRQDLGLTQAELAGNFITRNMLSQIENDTALPSIPTIKYLAAKLNIYAGYFLSERDDLPLYKKLYAIDDIKELYKTGKYFECAETCEKLCIQDDEIYNILSFSYFYLAFEKLLNGEFKKSEEYFMLSLNNNKKSLYHSEFAEDAVNLLLNYLRTDNFNDLFPQINIYSEMISYLYGINLKTEKDVKIIFNNNVLLKHTNAKNLIGAGNYKTAILILNDLYDTESAVLIKYLIAVDLEQCYVKENDYENAYKFLNIKNELHKRLYA